MFKKLTDFSYKRNGKEAFGFYLGYLLVGFILAGICGAFIPGDATTFQEGFEAGMASNMGPAAMTIYVFALSLLILIKRKLSFGYLVLLSVNLLAVVFGGGILGLIIPAFMTTRDGVRGE